MVATTERTMERRGRRIRRTARAALAACVGTSAVIAATLLAPAAAQAAAPGPVVVNTPGTTTWTVPNGVTSVRVELAGGAGGNRPIDNGFETVGNFGGSGDVLTGTLTVTPGEQLTLYVASAGGDGDLGGGSGSWGPSGGGYRAGGSGGTGSKLVGSLAQGGGGGGGASAIVRAGTPVAIAGGGGGAGGSAYCGGNPGGDAGADGAKTSKRCVSDGGDGGRAGTTNGTGGDGRDAKSSSGQGGGGGGGGGLRGGGGGDRSTDGGGGGGGGTSSLGTLFEGSAHPANRGNGYVVLSPTWSSTVAFDRQQYSGTIGQTLALTGTVGTLGMPEEKPEGTVTLRWQPTNVVLASVPATRDGTFSYTCTLPCGATGATRIEARFQPTDSNTWRSSVETSDFTALPAATRTDLEVDPGRTVTGQRRQLTATVSALPPASAIPVGSVQFFATPGEGGQEISLGTAAIGDDGRAVLEAAQPHAGEHQLRAVYAGADWFRSSQSPRKTVETAPARTTTTASVVPEPSVYGQATTVRVAVSPVAPGGGTPTGTVTVDGTAHALVGGTVDVPRPSSDAGTNTLRVRYEGSEDHLPSEANIVHETKRATAALVVQQSAPRSVYGEDVPLRISGSLNSPSEPSYLPDGAFNVWVDGVDSGVAGTFENGGADVILTHLSAGEHTIMVRTAGSANVEPAESQPISHVVDQADAVVTLAPRRPSITVGADALLDVRVQAVTSEDAPVSGTVEIRRESAAGIVVARGSVSADGRATLNWGAPDVGSTSLVAVYSGSDDVAAGTSAPAPLTVVKARSSVTVTAPTATRSDVDTTLRARVTTHEAPAREQVLAPTSMFAQVSSNAGDWNAFAPAGRVQFMADGKALGAPVPLTAVSGIAGAADAAVSVRVPVGTHAITARYLGEPRVEPATSAPSRLASAAPPAPRAAQPHGPSLAATGTASPGAWGLLAMILIAGGALAAGRHRGAVRR